MNLIKNIIIHTSKYIFYKWNKFDIKISIILIDNFVKDL